MAQNAQNSLDGPRPARPEEMETILALANQVMRTAQGREPSIATDYPFIYNESNAENIIVVMDRGRAVSMVGSWMNMVEAGDAPLKTGGINCLATLPGYRGRGLASRVMTEAVNHMARRDCHLGRLTTGITNWYHRLGWESAGLYRAYRFNHSNISLLPKLPPDVQIIQGSDFRDDVIDAIIRLRTADQLGGRRTRGIMRKLLTADSDPALMGNRQYVLAVRPKGSAAYCMDSNHGIIEWGGPADLVAGLIHERFNYRAGDRSGQSPKSLQDKVKDSPELTLVAPGTGHAFIEVLQSLGFPCEESYWGMLNILDPRGILDAFGADDVAVTEEHGRFTLVRGGESVSATRQELAKLFFGPERISEFARDILPFPFWQWPLEHV